MAAMLLLLVPDPGRPQRSLLLWGTAAVLAFFGVIRTAGAEPPVDYATQIRPLLAGRCFRCHGPDEGSREAGLRLDQRAVATAEADSGQRAVVPGDAEASELIMRVTADDPDMRMPPADAGKPLSAEEVHLLRRWIQQGAPYAQHWAFVPPQVQAAGPVSNPAWIRNPIDRYVLARLDRQGLPPAEEADRATLIRRVSLALIGLPPTQEEVERFLHDPAPDAYERLVERLLQSPAYGERWGRVWLDLARYADSAGYAQDPSRTIWRYRDWVIDAYNHNMPFDQFTIEQLAGDLLPDPRDDQLIATAFHRNTMTNSEGGTDDEEFRVAAIVDRVDTTMQVWMGLTMGCAQCHTHKYDPITQEEYFRTFAIFNNTADADRGDEAPVLVRLTAAQMRQQERLRAQIATVQAARPASEASAQATAAASDEKPTPSSELAELQKQLEQIQGVPTPIMRELPDDQQRTTRIHLRGDFRQPGPQVTAGVPAALHPIGAAEPNRLDLARWLVDPQNPLTARVTVNRFWEQLFGSGLVTTSEDFGTQGELPSHPQLLDYLACEFMRNGWDQKQLLRQIVTSATYRQSSHVSASLAAQDPQNRLLARGPRFRLPAEMIRDQALHIAGLLSTKMQGPSVHPPRPVLGLRAAFGGSTDWETSPGEDRYRRGLYTSWRRTTPYPSFTTFDAPSREVCTIRRVNTNTPLQALVTLNDPVFVEAAQALARRVMADGGSTETERIVFGFRLCTARAPREEEIQRLEALLQSVRQRYRQAPDQAALMATAPLGPAPPDADLVELAAWTVAGNVLLNLDEVLSPR